MAKQVSTKRMSLMFGIDSDDTHLLLKTSHRRMDEQRLESNLEVMKLFLMIMQVDRNGGLRVCGDLKTKSGPKPKQLVT